MNFCLRCYCFQLGLSSQDFVSQRRAANDPLYNLYNYLVGIGNKKSALLFVFSSLTNISYGKSFGLIQPTTMLMTEKNLELLLATVNTGKIIELKKLFAGLPVELRSLRDFDGITDVEETGATFEENAILKAGSYARQTGMFALADDSGLEIAALDNRPGVMSARYAGDDTGFEEKMAKLLWELDRTGDDDRSARFVCVMALANERGKIQFTSKGICEGMIDVKPRGSNGFGYDPIFVPTGFDRTFGELSSDIKQEIGHRGRASAIIIQYLLDFIAV